MLDRCRKETSTISWKVSYPPLSGVLSKLQTTLCGSNVFFFTVKAAVMDIRGSSVLKPNIPAGALYDLCNQDALCIVEQDVFDKIYSLTR
jgi:hypothetical protein